MKSRPLSLGNRKGYILVVVGMSMIALLSFFALVVDLGHIFVTKAELQNTSDAAVLAAVVEIPNGIAAAKQKAVDFGQKHFVAGDQIIIENSKVVFGNYDFLNQKFNANLTPYNYVTVTARKVSGAPSGALPLFFARFFGKDFTDVQASSRAVLDRHVVGVKGKNRLIPYSVINFMVDQKGDGRFDVGSTIDIFPRSDAPGNFGFLDLDYGSNDVPELRQYIEEGYDSDFVIPPGGSKPVYGSTGIDGESLINSFNVIIGDVVFLPVHNRVDYEGANAIYNVIAILAVRIQSIKLNGTINKRYIMTQIIDYASSVLVTDPNAPENPTLAKPRLVA